MPAKHENGTAFGLSLRLAWRNIWRQKRRTWLTALAMIFSNILLVFMISLQFGSYDMMINNTLTMFTGQLQVQHEGYLENQKMREVVDDIHDLASNIREQFTAANVAARANAFVLVSSEDRSFGTRAVVLKPKNLVIVAVHR